MCKSRMLPFLIQSVFKSQAYIHLRNMSQGRSLSWRDGEVLQGGARHRKCNRRHQWKQGGFTRNPPPITKTQNPTSTLKAFYLVFVAHCCNTYIFGSPELRSLSFSKLCMKVTEQWMREFGYYLDILAVSCDSFVAEVGNGTDTINVIIITLTTR